MSLLTKIQFIVIVITVFQSVVLIECYSPSHVREVAHYEKRQVVREIPEINVAPPKPGWIDPFDMTGGATYSQDSLIVQSDVDNHLLKNRIVNCELNIRRFVNMFLRAIQRQEPNAFAADSEVLVKLDFITSVKNLNILKTFGENEDEIRLDRVSEILSSIFSQDIRRNEDKHAPFYQPSFQFMKKMFIKLAKSPEWTVLSSVSLMLIATLWFVYKTHSYRLALFTVLLTVFFAGFGFTWIRMYEEEEVRRFTNLMEHGNAPYHCTGKQLQWYEHMYYRLFGVDCFEFYKIRDVSPMSKISPTDVLAQTFSSMIVNPASNIGKAYGDFIKNVNASVPWYLKPISIPLSFLVPMIFVILLLALLFNYKLGISWIGGFYLTPSWCQSNCPVQHKNESQYIEDLSRKGSLQQNIPGLSDDKSPLIVMNIQGLKKLISSVNENTSDEGEAASSRNNLSETGDPEGKDTSSVVENKDSIALATAAEKELPNENCRKRTKSIFTFSKGNSPTNIYNLDVHELPASDSASGDQIVSAVVHKEDKSV